MFDIKKAKLILFKEQVIFVICFWSSDSCQSIVEPNTVKLKCLIYCSHVTLKAEYKESKVFKHNREPYINRYYSGHKTKLFLIIATRDLRPKYCKYMSRFKFYHALLLSCPTRQLFAHPLDLPRAALQTWFSLVC